jgi:ribonuclease HI
MVEDWEETQTVYTDGSCSNQGTESVKAGAGVWFGQNDRRNLKVKIPKNLNPSNQVGEIMAAKAAAEKVDDSVGLEIISDSKHTINGLCKYLRKWEDRGFIGVTNETPIKVTAARLSARQKKTTFKWVKGHSGVEGNEGADKLAGEAADLPTESNISMDIPPALKLTGAKLTSMTQALAYRGIRGIRMRTEKYQEKLKRRATNRNISEISRSFIDRGEEPPAQDKIWKSIRRKDFPRTIRYFLWMAIHGGYKLGTKAWEHITGCEDRGVCKICGGDETMEHILVECPADACQKAVWKLAAEMWSNMTSEWDAPSFGDILAMGLSSVVDVDGKTKRGETRLRRIIIAESAYLIWKLRNERVVDGREGISLREVKNRWWLTMEGRRKLDLTLSTKFFHNKIIIKKSLVRATWKDTVLVNQALPYERENGVLVGIG